MKDARYSSHYSYHQTHVKTEKRIGVYTTFAINRQSLFIFVQQSRRETALLALRRLHSAYAIHAYLVKIAHLLSI